MKRLLFLAAALMMMVTPAESASEDPAGPEHDHWACMGSTFGIIYAATTCGDDILACFPEADGMAVHTAVAGMARVGAKVSCIPEGRDGQTVAWCKGWFRCNDSELYSNAEEEKGYCFSNAGGAGPLYLIVVCHNYYEDPPQQHFSDLADVDSRGIGLPVEVGQRVCVDDECIVVPPHSVGILYNDVDPRGYSCGAMLCTSAPVSCISREDALACVV